MAQPTRKLENLLTTFNSTLSGLFICHAHRRKEGRGNGARRLRENFSALSALSERAAGKKTLVFLDFEILVMSPVNFVFVKRPLSQGKFAQSTQK